MGGGGFEPPKQFAADLQSVPFGHSGIRPYEIFISQADNRYAGTLKTPAQLAAE